MKKSLLSLAVAALAAAASAQMHYYVDAVKGLDTNPGTQAQPWQSISFAVTAAPLNTIIHVLPGVYSAATTSEKLPINIGKSGSIAQQNMKLLGVDAKACILDLGGATATPAGAGFVFGQFAVDVELANLTIRNGSANPGWWEYGIQIGGWKSDFCARLNIHHCVLDGVVRGITLWGDNSNEVFIHDNVFLNCKNDCIDIYDKGRVYVYNNLMNKGQYLGILLSGGPESADNTVVANNIVLSCNEGIVSDTAATTHVLEGNCCFQNTTSQYRTKAALSPSNLLADPLLVNLAGGDYRLQAGSPCIEAGYHAILPGMVNDFYGNGRAVDVNDDGAAVPDIGLHEVNPVALTLVKNWGQGLAPEFQVSGSPALALTCILFVGYRASGSTQFPIYGLDPFGTIGVDPTSWLLGLFTTVPSPPNWAPFAIPTDPYLTGVPVFVQALAFRNTGSMMVFKPTGRLDLYL